MGSNLDPDISLEPNWTDLRVPITSTKLGGSKDPTFSKVADNGAGSQGVFAYNFNQNQEQELYFITQMPHGWHIGTDIDCHVHWSPTNTDTGNVRWGIEYTVTNEGQALNPTAIVSTDIAAGGIAGVNQVDDITIIDMSNAGLSAIILVRIFREAAHANDTYNSDAALLEVDFHYQQDSLGSNAELSKG